MRFVLFTGALAALAAAGCASHLSTARTYAELGKHELAVFYLGGHYQTEHSPEARKELVHSVENAARSLEARTRDLLKQGLATAALGAATRLEGLYDFARRLGLQEFAAVDAARLARQARPQALAQAVRAVDRAEADERPAKELTSLLRQALALDPHNPELAGRYERVRSSVKLSLALKTECPASHRKACHQFLDQLTTLLSRERREFTQLVDPSSGKPNAELTATLRVDTHDSDWHKTRSGQAEQEIPIKNKFRENRLDAEGNPITRTVRASYQMFERTTRANVKLLLKIHDLRDPGGLLFETDRHWTESDQRRYLIWSGDQRALGELARIGSDQTPPKNTADLVRISTHKLAELAAGLVLATLEGSGK